MFARRKLWSAVAACTLAVVGAWWRPAAAQEPASPAQPQAADQGAAAWTLNDAVAHLQLFPRDAYVQYVALQLARREGRTADVANQILSRNPNRDRFQMRQGQIDLFSIFSGSLAVQESLQLDAMAVDQLPGNEWDAGPDAQVVPPRRQGPRPLEPTAAPTDNVAVSELEGPTIKSHPWREMLAGKTPDVKGLALKAPADFYFVSFRSVNKLIEAADVASLWGAHLTNQSAHSAQTQLVNDRLRGQLAIEVNPALRPFYDAVIDEAALVGSDLFLREGSDVTLLLHTTQPAVMRTQMDQFLAKAASSRDDATREEGQYLGVDWVYVATPDRRIHIYSAYPTPDLHVRSNSRVGLERVLEAIAGRDAGGQPVARLGETDEFRYVRTLMPQGAPEEDGFVFLSDPFVRRLMSPTVRLTERRRMVCYNHLRMIGHAGLMYRTQTGKTASSLKDLADAHCAPGEFDKGKFACPEHGQYTLGADGLTGVCSRHGYASYLTPCSEIETTQVSEPEAEAYRQFLQMYNSYWRQFFDPIAIRLQVTPERYRAETIVLPLIDNSIYTGLARALGGEPEPLDALPVPKRNIFSFAVRLNKEQLLRDAGLEHLLEPPQGEMAAEMESLQRAINSLKQLALAMLNHEAAKRRLPEPASRDAGGRPLLSWRVHVLPFLEQGELYRQFRLDEPWDSEHNRALIARMPDVYRPDDAALAKEGKTRFLTLRGEGTAFPPDRDGLYLKEIADGLSNTYLLIEADDLHATIWTRPDDLEVDLKQPTKGLHSRPPGAFLGVMCDGSVKFLRTDSDAPQIAAMFTRAGEEPIADDRLRHVRLPAQPRGRILFGGLPDELLNDLQVGEFLTKGIGNQIGVHVYDAEPMFDLSLTQLLGQPFASRGGMMRLDNEFFMIAPLIGSLASPVYLSIPVRDREIVDAFLDRLDNYLVQMSKHSEGFGFFRIEQDYYQLPAQGDRPVRAYGFRFGPLKWRFFWGRIGDGLYIASKREVLDDLAALDSAGGAPPSRGDLTAHGMVRLRPKNWDRVVGAYQLGWEENNREACLNNTGPLASLGRALASCGAGEASTDRLEDYAARLYDVHHFCPDGGEYHVLPDGRTVECSVHHTVHEPRQAAAPAEQSELGKLLRDFRDLSVTLTFLEDGLHAVVTLEREP